MRAGSGFNDDQHSRLERAIEAAQQSSGWRFALAVGPGEGGDLREEGERSLARLVDGRPVGAVLVLVDPQARRLEILTTGAARRRLEDSACALAALSMSSSFGVGDLIGGLIDGLRMLGDASSAPGDTPQLGSSRGEPATLDG